MDDFKVFGRPQDFDLVRRILKVVEQERLAGAGDRQRLDKLRRAAMGEEPLDRFDRAELTSLYQYYLNLAVQHVGIERLLGDAQRGTCPTIPPAAAEGALAAEGPPSPNPDAVVEQMRSLALSTTRAQRYVGKLSSDQSELAFLFEHLQEIMTSLTWLSSEGQIATATASELTRTIDYLERARLDLDDILFITGVADDLVLEAGVEDLIPLV